jgi:hypothetical protein
MRSSDRIVSWVVLAPIAPIALLLVGWWGSLPALHDSPAVGLIAISGLVIGLALDATVLRRRMETLVAMGDRALLLVALFYSIGMYGFFMGFPVFNVAIAAVGGYVVARRAAVMGWPRQRALRDGRRVAIAMTWVLGLLCASTAWLALNEATMGSQLTGMFRLPFLVTRPMIYAIIVVGGVGLLAFQYAVTVLGARFFAPR